MAQTHLTRAALRPIAERPRNWTLLARTALVDAAAEARPPDADTPATPLLCGSGFGHWPHWAATDCFGLSPCLSAPDPLPRLRKALVNLFTSRQWLSASLIGHALQVNSAFPR